MSAKTHVSPVATSLLTVISLFVPSYALPHRIPTNKLEPFKYANKDIECALRFLDLPTDQRLVPTPTWRIIMPITILVLAILLLVRWFVKVRQTPRHQTPHYVPGRKHSVHAGEPIPSPILSRPPEESPDDPNHDLPEAPSNRGKTRLAASVSDDNPSRCNVVRDWAISCSPSAQVHDSDLGYNNNVPLADAPAIIKPSLPSLKRVLARLIRWIEAPGNPPPNPARARHPTWSVVIARSSSVPDPRSPDKVQFRARYQTLPQDADLPPLHPIETQTLQKSLLTGSKDFSAPPPKKLSVLVAAVNDGLDDPEHDHGVLEGIFQSHIANPSLIRFSSLAGDDATLIILKGWFIWLYLLASLDRSNFLVLLSGRGNKNQMCLPGGAFLAESDICKWVSTIRDKFKLPSNRTPTIVLNICRESDVPGVSTGNLVNIIRSCSLKQLAHAIGFDSQDMFRSCFCLAFFLAANDRPSSPAAFKTALTCWLGKVGKLRAQIHDWCHARPGRCGDCTGENMCGRPELQTIEEGYAGWADLYEFGTFIATNHAGPMRAVVERVTEEMRAIEIWSQSNSAPYTSHNPQLTPIV